MKTFHIQKIRFLQWYFSEDCTEESTTIREDLAELVIKHLLKSNSSTITTSDIFDDVNKQAIKLSYLEQFDLDDERELEDLPYECEVILID